LTPGFGRRVAIVVIVAIGLALVLQVATADGPDAVSGSVGGDYPSFYAAGSIVLDDPGLDSGRFYEPDRQFEAQGPVLGADRDGNLFFAYPAFFVVPFVPLAALDFGASYLVHTLLMAFALAGALLLLRPLSATVRSHPVEAFALALTFFPMFRGVTGGQNTALSLLLIAVTWRSLDHRRDLPAGVAAALLLFKPPLALPFLGALVLARRWRAVGAAAGTVVALDLLGAAATDLAWPSAWADAVRYLDRVDTPFNVQNFVSMPGAAEALFGIDSAAANVVGFGLAALIAVGVAHTWLRDIGTLGERIALTTAGALAMSPHALYYDAGLLVLVGIVLIDDRPDLRRWLPLAWLAGFTHLAAEPLVGAADHPPVRRVLVAIDRGAHLAQRMPQLRFLLPAHGHPHERHRRRRQNRQQHDDDEQLDEGVAVRGAERHYLILNCTGTNCSGSVCPSGDVPAPDTASVPAPAAIGSNWMLASRPEPDAPVVSPGREITMSTRPAASSITGRNVTGWPPCAMKPPCETLRARSSAGS